MPLAYCQINKLFVSGYSYKYELSGINYSNVNCLCFSQLAHVCSLVRACAVWVAQGPVVQNIVSLTLLHSE